MTNNINFINLTPHTITIFREGIENIVVPPSGITVRCKTTNTVVGQINSIPIVQTVYGEVEGLPEPQDNTYYLVSGFVMTALRGTYRTDVFKPEDFVRDEAGNIIGCRQLMCLD